MKRRHFFQTLGSSALTLQANRAGLLGAEQPATNGPVNYAQIPGVLPGDAEAYFTEEKLHRWIDTRVPLRLSVLTFPPGIPLPTWKTFSARAGPSGRS